MNRLSNADVADMHATYGSANDNTKKTVRLYEEHCLFPIVICLVIACSQSCTNGCTTLSVFAQTEWLLLVLGEFVRENPRASVRAAANRLRIVSYSVI